MISKSTTPFAILMLLTMLATLTTATDGYFSMTMRISALTSTPVKTTVSLQGIQQTVTVTEANATDIFITYTMDSDTVLDNKPMELHVYIPTDSDFKEYNVSIDRNSTTTNFFAGLVRIVSSGSCAKNYYGRFCKAFCKEIPGLHFTCDSEGRTICMAGWQGDKCQERVCPVACVHGHCDGDRCLCRPGFTGAACDQCIPAAGCVNGGCANATAPGTCACRQGWSGPKCNIDLTLCSRQSPCASGSTCIMKGPGTMECICPEGKTGAHCDIAVEKPCPCKNGGTCLPANVRSRSAHVCKCPSGFQGPTCDRPTAAVPDSSNNQNWLLVLSAAQLLCLVLVVIAVIVLIVIALRFIKSSRPCGGPAPLPEQQPKQQQHKLSSVSLLLPDDLDSAPFCKGDDLFCAAKEHAKKVVVFDTIDEPRYSACPKKSSIFSIPDPTPTVVEKTYESLPL